MAITAENVRNTREWNLLVVNDEKVANAMATFGVYLKPSPRRRCPLLMTVS
jgi:hypothetical protein